MLTPATPAPPLRRVKSAIRCNVPERHFYRDGEHGGLAGHCGACRPFSDGLPLGLQLIGKPFDEETLFQTAYAIEQAAGLFTPKQWW